jgi:hexosaminidase
MTHLKTTFGLLLIIIFFVTVSCNKTPDIKSNLNNESLIPYPAYVNATNSVYDLRSSTYIYYTGNSKQAEFIALYLQKKLKKQTGLYFHVEKRKNINSRGINLFVNKIDTIKNREAYRLTIENDNIRIRGNSKEGIFRGVQTLLQLIPSSSIDSLTANRKYYVATGKIVDYPRYKYRGAMLDVARHFFNVSDVKQFIDYLSWYKMNRFHIHLTDDQGWRIEIKSWPNLTAHGSKTQVGGGKGGFYTQEQFKDIVEYAKQRYIIVVPEIDMPGHTNAALSSYPELNCDKKTPKLYSGIEVGFSTLCARDSITYKFIDDVINEISKLSSGSYIHIGGDESHATEHDDYMYFVSKALSIVNNHNKFCIGWDEIAQTDIKPNTIVQYWNNDKNTKLAVTKGAKVILSPASVAYMDIKYTDSTKLGLTWAGLTEVDDAYCWKPDTVANLGGDKNIYGIEAVLWTETIETLNDIEYMIFPRLLGYSELAWSPAEVLNWEKYKLRLAKQAKRFELKRINFYRSPVIDWE